MQDKTVLSREQEAISKRTRALQEKLQTLVKSAAPLKQIMNYVQEDVDTMRKELSFWSGEIAKNTEMLHREKQLVQHHFTLGCHVSNFGERYINQNATIIVHFFNPAEVPRNVLQ